MDFYNIVLIQPASYPHSMALREIGLLLYHSFQSLGIPSDFRLNQFEDSANIVLGYHLLNDPGVVLTHPCIIYQLEQLSDREGWFNETRLEILRQAREVWDYSPENVRFLRDKGIQNVKLLPIGFHEKLQTISKADPTIDVLFYGSLNPRRNAVLTALMKHCHVELLFNVYGKERDLFISRSKIVLNIHFFAAQIMEQVRISYLLNNGCFVISEDAGLNPYKSLVTAPLDGLVDCCRRYLNAPEERERSARENFSLFCRQPMVDFLKEVL